MNLLALLAIAAAALLAALFLVFALRRERRPAGVCFMLAASIACASQIALFFMAISRAPAGAASVLSEESARVLVSFRVLLGLLILFPAAAIPFFVLYGEKGAEGNVARRLPAFALLAAFLAALAFMVPASRVASEVYFVEDTGAFWGMAFSGLGKAIAVFLYLVNVFFLFSFENAYRRATVPGKVTLKYPLLGILTASIINFIVLSRVLAIAVLDRNYLAVHSCGVIALAASLIFAGTRYDILAVQPGSRRMAPSALSIIVAGLYLIALGLISFLARYAGMPFDRFVLTVLGIFVVFLLLAVLISGKAKRRLRMFLIANVYPSRYNYRREWRHYASLMASGATIGDFLANVVSSLCDTMMVRRGFIWADVKGGRTAFYGFEEDRLDSELVERLRASIGTEPVSFFRKAPFGIGEGEPWVRAVASLGQGEDFRGLIVLGEKHPGASYNDEDEDFLATIADQAKLALDNLLMEERMIEARQMESFNRFASFVIHDLKNTVGMLSLVAENARDNMGSPEFQRDALETIRRSVSKMQNLIDSLNVRKAPPSIVKGSVELSSLVGSWTAALAETAAAKGVTLECAAPGSVTVRVDPNALRRVIENLVLNAVEATPAGGAVAVSVEREGDDRVRIDVRDTGEGFSPEYLREHAFHPFHSTKKGGLGIGLVLCRSLVEAHGGTIRIESMKGEGATVSVILPIGGHANA